MLLWICFQLNCFIFIKIILSVKPNVRIILTSVVCSETFSGDWKNERKKLGWWVINKDCFDYFNDNFVWMIFINKFDQPHFDSYQLSPSYPSLEGYGMGWERGSNYLHPPPIHNFYWSYPPLPYLFVRFFTPSPKCFLNQDPPSWLLTNLNIGPRSKGGCPIFGFNCIFVSKILLKGSSCIPPSYFYSYLTLPTPCVDLCNLP